MDSLRATLDERGVSLVGAQVCDFGCGIGLLTQQLVDTVESIDATIDGYRPALLGQHVPADVMPEARREGERFNVDALVVTVEA